MQVSELFRRKAGPCTWSRVGRRPREGARALSRGHVTGDNVYKLVTSGKSDQIGMKNNGIHISH